MINNKQIKKGIKMETIKKFILGKEYQTRSICDYDCIFKFTILARTDKSVKVSVHNNIVSRRIKIYNGAETFYPFGSYSMCPIIKA